MNGAETGSLTRPTTPESDKLLSFLFSQYILLIHETRTKEHKG